MKLNVGQKAPSFSLPDQDGKMRALKDYMGSWLLIYFYPKDDTPGCTKEACGFRDNLPTFKKLKVPILGISVDTVKSHRKFADKFGLPFILLADEDKQVVSRYDVWQKKKMYGREYMGTMRTSFLIDPQGKIAHIYEGVKPEIHPEQVLSDLQSHLKKSPN